MDGHILITVHLRNEVQIVAKVLPVEGEKRTVSIRECSEKQTMRKMAYLNTVCVCACECLCVCVCGWQGQMIMSATTYSTNHQVKLSVVLSLCLQSCEDYLFKRVDTKIFSVSNFSNSFWTFFQLFSAGD